MIYIDPQTADVARWVFLGVGAFLAGIAIQIAYRYARLPGRTRSRVLNVHIISISFSYFILVGVACVDITTNFAKPASWKLPAGVIAFALGLYGLQNMIWHLRYERRAIRNTGNFESRCHACGSHVVDNFCARCGAKIT